MYIFMLSLTVFFLQVTNKTHGELAITAFVLGAGVVTNR